jgi:hypothetical protein
VRWYRTHGERFHGALLLVRRDRSIAVGLALRFAERARGIALAWLKGQGA